MDPIQYQLDNLQFEHSLWLNELAHAFAEISIYQKRIKIMIEPSFSTDDQEELEMLLKGFTEQKSAITYIKNQILENLVDIRKKAKLNGALKAVLQKDHSEIKERLIQFRNELNELRNRFHKIIEWQK
ncbi:MAG: hypothetical protein KJP00_01210 [Bacteroidia bacterium]|nr:hypothetical protein [Bacteroidia bacterium]